MATFAEAIKLYWSQYVGFSGRSSRSEYWWAYLFVFLVQLPFSILNMISTLNGDTFSIWYFIILLWGLANLLPGLAIAVRRMHDIGKGGGWIFITFVPLIGWIWFLVLLLTPSEPYENRFGVPYEDQMKY